MVLDPLPTGDLVGVAIVDAEEVEGALLAQDLGDLPHLHVSQALDEDRPHVIRVRLACGPASPGGALDLGVGPGERLERVRLRPDLVENPWSRSFAAAKSV